MSAHFKHLDKGSAEALAHTTRFLADVLRRGEAMTMKEIWDAGSTRGWVPMGGVGSSERVGIKEGELEYPVTISKTDLKQRILPSLRAQGVLQRAHLSTPTSAAQIDPLTRGLRLSSLSLPKGRESETMLASQSSRGEQHAGEANAAGVGSSSASGSTPTSIASGKKSSAGSTTASHNSVWVWSLPPYLQTPPRVNQRKQPARDSRLGRAIFPELIQKHFPALIARSGDTTTAAVEATNGSPSVTINTISDLARIQAEHAVYSSTRTAAHEVRTQRGRAGIRLTTEEMDGLGLNKRRRRARVGKEKRVEGEVVAFKNLVAGMRKKGKLARLAEA